MNKQVLVCFLSAAFVVVALTSCAGAPSRATCFECTTTPQKWSEFGFSQLEGTWRGTQHFSLNSAEATKPVEKQKSIEVTFLEGRKFLRAYKVSPESCGAFPAEAVVLLNEMWWDKSTAPSTEERAFEVFGKLDGDKVSYGRAYVTRTKSGNRCDYVGNENPIVMNRLQLPAVVFSRRLTSDGRALASGVTKEVDINFEFLNFEHARVRSEHRYSGKKEKEAPLFFRFVKITRNVRGAFDHGDWAATEEKLFRLWRVN